MTPNRTQSPQGAAKTEAKEIVLFDDDYRRHIELLNTKCEWLTAEVIRLREKVNGKRVDK